MKRGSNTPIFDRVDRMSIQDLILTILVLVVLITLIILIATVIAQNANLDIDEVGWLTALSTVLLGMCRSCEIFD